jgi:antitoxin component YwqK of YwqJK toxin-antitoxin module
MPTTVRMVPTSSTTSSEASICAANTATAYEKASGKDSKGLNPDGSVRSVTTYVRGRRVGSSKHWNLKKILIHEEHFDDQGETVRFESFFDDGSKRRSGSFLPRRGFETEVRRTGTWTYWNQAGKVVAEGEWKEGKPWSGVCGVLLASDAGSAGGIETFGRYEEGKLIEKLTIRP